jgi:hypothetical protein
MIRKLVVWSVVVLFASGYTACKKAEFTVETPKSEEQADTRTVADATAEQRARGEVLAIATQLARGDSKGKTRAVPDFDVEYVLTSAVQKERLNALGFASVDTMLYILNERDGSGFSLISGDKRVPELLAYSDEGHLDIRHVDNPGLAIFLSRLPIFFEQELMKSDRVKREYFKEAPREGSLREYRYSAWEDLHITPNYVPVAWHQFEPFNNNAPMRGGKHAVAGCVATAVAQFMAAHKYPAWYKGQYLDWELLVRDKWDSQETKKCFEKEVARLFRSLGDALCNSWGKESTSARAGKVTDILKNMKYKGKLKWRSYNTGSTIESINHGHPVFLSGSSEAIEIPLIGITFGIGGHVWLCDGYRVRERSVEVFDWLERKVIYRKKETLRLLHCNWGWGVSSNGYYYAGVFDSKNRVIKDSVLNGSREGYYQYDIEQIADVYH